MSSIMPVHRLVVSGKGRAAFAVVIAIILAAGGVGTAQTQPAPAGKGSPLTAEQREALTTEAKHLWEDAQRLDKEGKIKEAVAAGQGKLALNRRLLGDAHQDIATDLIWLAVRYEQQDDLAAAKLAREEILGIKVGLLGAEHWQVTDARLALKRLELLYGMTMQQRQAIQEAIKITQTARELAKDSKPSEAVPLGKKALKIRQELLGEEHPDYAQSLKNLGWFHRDLREYDQAEPLYHKALEIQKKSLGERHPDFALTVNNIGWLHFYRQEWDQAESCFLNALQTYKDTVGESNEDYATSLNNLYSMYSQRGDYAKAEPFCRQALEIRTRILGEEHRDTASSMNNLASLCKAMGDYARAEPLYRQALEIKKKALGEAHPDYATSLGSLAVLYWEMGDYARAELLYLQAMEIRKKTQGEAHPHYATTLSSLAVLYSEMGDYARAEPLYRQALEIDKKALGENHLGCATDLCNLALLYNEMGDYARAEPLHRQAVEIRKKVLGEMHPDYAHSLNNLAMLYHLTGDYARAEPLYRQALEIWKKALGEAHPRYASSLSNLAWLYHYMGDYARAEPLHRQALEITKNALGEAHPKYALRLNNLAWLYFAMGEYARAEPLCRQALEIKKKALGEAHPAYAMSLNTLAELYRKQSDYARAEPLYRQTLEIRKKALGEAHHDYGSTLSDLALLYVKMGDNARAEPLYRQAIAISLSNAELAAAVQSERQQLAMGESVRSYLHRYLVLATAAPEFQEQAYRQLLAWKGAVLTRQQAIRAVRDNPELQPKYLELEQVAAQFARLAFATPAPDQQPTWRQKSAALSERKERLERELADLSGAYRKARQAVTLEDLRAALPKGAALVDLIKSSAARTPKGNGKSERVIEERFLAFIVRPDGPVELIALGQTEEIEKQIDAWRMGFGHSEESRKAALWLRENVWAPLEEKLGATKIVLISPDGAMGKLPFAALPGKEPGTFLVEEDRLIAVVPSAAALVKVAGTLRAPTGSAEVNGTRSLPTTPRKNLLLLGGIDYNRGAPQISDVAATTLPRKFGRAPREDSSSPFDPLPGSRGELATIKLLYEGQEFDRQSLTTMQAGAATEEAFRREASQHKYLHLATHGFFAAEKHKSALSRTTTERDRPEQVSLITEQSISGFHPNLLSGIALAGANQPPDEGDDGILTAEEVQTLDLRASELVVLSACETGLGKSAGGEGLLGLQRAFQGAGARTVIASLWKVDDVATRDLMERFYDNLWNKNMGKLEALREAQLWMLKERGPRGLVAAERTGDRSQGTGNTRLPPYYWAAWVLSGDWR